ncbi:acyl-CoA thioesterase [Novosphingobium sp.]|uniref:acyl-CoA thioesterase n=1 Tax=Novosphingobium sp. TaxID=1874826 RepID=UPI0025FC755F|nr:acyl-CoA thioesterase [Novosphingobium sp.]MCC6927178.1 acyl-CoA thioesterase [Novosphingobium sp.]
MPRPEPALLDPARYPFAHQVTTRFADIDPNQHLNNVALAAMMEDARVRFNLEMRGRIRIGERRAMVASVGMEYLSQGHFPDPVTVHCGIEGVGRTSWTIVQLLEQGGRAVAFARSVIVAIDDDRPAPIDQDYRLALLENWGLKA